MSDFTQDLMRRNQSERSAQIGHCYLLHFKNWCIAETVDPKGANQENILAFIRFSREKGNRPRTLQQKLYYIRLWFAFIERSDNPCEGVRIRGVKKHLPPKPLSKQKLIGYYENYQPQTLADRRNKIILGFLMIYGVEQTCLERIEVKDIYLQQGKIRFPETRRTNERLLSIEHTGFLLELQNYLLRDRPMLLRILGQDTELLFFSTYSTGQLKN